MFLSDDRSGVADSERSDAFSVLFKALPLPKRSSSSDTVPNS